MTDAIGDVIRALLGAAPLLALMALGIWVLTAVYRIGTALKARRAQAKPVPTAGAPGVVLRQ
ncbi:hypothetical protein [Agrococcus casei]|uniref:Uncharacterized protein n=1 Tax=Agrococcus casei LMG 22410 TaxID=1255656 RepID=A0A1R4EVZ8_9MICO|nr:hypothetical protein [Agrococcus casei]SJM47854.1 hypothetical protein CZ674_01280 [Agrococcus casei LMG 22410]